MRTIPEVAEDIKGILNNIERTENCDGETLVDINELVDEILTINAYMGLYDKNALKDLISRRAFRKILIDMQTDKDRYDNAEKRHEIGVIISKLDEQPTAYDVEKVVSLIKTLKGYTIYKETFDLIIQIVRDGGIE